jgi:hypothetical protein
LTRKVLGEFDPRPGGLFLSGDKVVKRFEGQRLRRVAWKMVRGLHFHHTGEVLPEHWSTVGVQIFNPKEQQLPPDVLTFAAGAVGRGAYPGVFDYKFDKFPEANNVHYWLLLIWDRLSSNIS